MAGTIENLTVDKPWLMLGDCLELMAEIPDGSVDMVLCDLPYGVGACPWDAVIPFRPLWNEYRRVLLGYGAVVLTASQPFTTTLIQSNLPWFKYSWVWEKSRPGDVFNAKNKPLKAHEDICVFSPGVTANGGKFKMPYYPQGVGPATRGVSDRNNRRDSSFRGKRPSHADDYTPQAAGYPRSVLRFSNGNKGSVHPTQKPVALLEYLIRTYTHEGETVLDNCFGSGSTGVACLNTGRRFIGIERDPHYFDVGRRRIDAAIAATNQSAIPGGLFTAQDAAE